MNNETVTVRRNQKHIRWDQTLIGLHAVLSDISRELRKHCNDCQFCNFETDSAEYFNFLTKCSVGNEKLNNVHTMQLCIQQYEQLPQPAGLEVWSEYHQEFIDADFVKETGLKEEK